MSGRESLFRHGDPIDAADAFVLHAMEGEGWEGRDNYPGWPERSNWVERGVGDDCERFIEQPLDDYESARVEILLSVARLYHEALKRIEAMSRPLPVRREGGVLSTGRVTAGSLESASEIARSALKEAEGGN